MSNSSHCSNDTDRCKRSRRHYSAEDKVAILRLHLLEGVPASDVCERHGIRPTLFYRWQKDFLENGAAAFSRKGRPRDESVKDRRIEALQAILAAKNEVIAELMVENVQAKKEAGEL
jgi:transposase-like protein